MDLLDVAGLGVDAFKLGYNLFTNQRDFDYQKALQQQMFQREDTAVQRRMADLKAAGINPNLAAGSAAGAGSVVSRSNTNDLGSALDTMMAVNSIKQQRQQVHNAKIEGDILETKKAVENQQRSLFEMQYLHNLGFGITPFMDMRTNKLGYYYYPNGSKIKTKDYEWTPELTNKLFNSLDFEYKNLKNSADILQKDVDWYTADKVSELTFGLFGLGNSASGWRKALERRRK